MKSRLLRSAETDHARRALVTILAAWLVIAAVVEVLL